MMFFCKIHLITGIKVLLSASLFIYSLPCQASDAAEKYQQTIKKFLKTANLKLAIDDLNQITKFYPDYYPAYFDLGLLYEKNQNYQQAIKSFQTYLNFDKASPRGKKAQLKIKTLTPLLQANQEQINDYVYRTHLNIAKGWIRSYLYIQAVNELDVAIRLKPKGFEAYALYAALLIQMKKYTDALKFIDIAEQLAPVSNQLELATVRNTLNNLLEAEDLLQKAESDINQSNYTQAIDSLKRVLILDPKNQQAQLKLSDTFIRMLLPAEAEPLVKQLMKSENTQVVQAAKTLLDDINELKKILIDFQNENNNDIESKSDTHEVTGKLIRFIMKNNISGLSISVSSNNQICVNYSGGSPNCTFNSELLSNSLDRYSEGSQVFLIGHEGWILINEKGKLAMQNVPIDLEKAVISLIENRKPIQKIISIENGFAIIHSKNQILVKNLPFSLSQVVIRLIENGNTIQDISYYNGSWVIIARVNNNKFIEYSKIPSNLANRLNSSNQNIEKVILLNQNDWIIDYNGWYDYQINF